MNSQHSRRYCDRFSSMVETVLTDHIPQSTNGCVSTVTDGVGSSLSSSKDQDIGVSGYAPELSRQACFQESTLESDLINSSFSLPGESPGIQRFKPDYHEKRKSLCYFDSHPLNKERYGTSSKSNFSPATSKVKRWKYANSRSLRYNRQSKSKPCDFLPCNSSLCLESDKKLKSPPKNSFIDLNEFSNLKQTVM